MILSAVVILKHSTQSSEFRAQNSALNTQISALSDQHHSVQAAPRISGMDFLTYHGDLLMLGVPGEFSL